MRWWRTFYCILLLSISFAFAENIIITEIMYDVDGTDTDREWIEIYNAGNTSINLSTWKFQEAGTDHRLSIKLGSDILDPDGYAVIADSSDNFQEEYPSFNGTLFDSSWGSLSNTGEYLAISNGSSIINELNYSSSWGGSSGYSLELHDLTLNNSNESAWNTSVTHNGTPGYQNSLVVVCTFNLVNETSEWQNQTTCLTNNTYIQNRSIIKYDQNNCGEIQNETFHEFQQLTCDYCIPNWTAVNTSCQHDESITEWYNDTRSCFQQTNLSSDTEIPANVTHFLACDINENHVIGNVSHINTTLSNLTFTVDNSSRTLSYNNYTLIEFDLATLFSFSSLSVTTQDNTSSVGYIIVSGIPSMNKTFYLNNVDPSIDTVCVKDASIENVSEISSDCTGINETLVTCDNSTQSGYRCESIENSTRYQISGLAHSGVIELSVSVVSSSSSSSPSIGGGGGGGGGGRRRVVQNVTIPGPPIETNDIIPATQPKRDQTVRVNITFNRSDFTLLAEKWWEIPQNVTPNRITGAAVGTTRKYDPVSIATFVALFSIILVIGVSLVRKK